MSYDEVEAYFPKTYSVESGIPIPDTPGRRRSRYPWPMMGVGDSFFVTDETAGDGFALRSAASYACRRGGHGRFYVGKTEGGFRVWRIE